MTRFLSESLQAPEPFFRLHLRRLEQAHGNPSADIHLTSAIAQATAVKIKQLGLDPADSTAEEIYVALKSRIAADDARLTRRLRTLAATHISAEAEVVAGLAQALQALPINKSCYALKAIAFKRLIKSQPPKKVMKSLGYRSLESMLKQEAAAAIMAAALICEAPAWQRSLFDKYKKLTPRDFENRQLAIVRPNTRRWQRLTTDHVAARRHNLLAFPELGAIVLLPLPKSAPAGAVTASLGLALHALNEVRASCSYLKLCQVRPDFGLLVQQIACNEPQLQTSLLDRQVPWQVIQRFYARLQNYFSDQLFEPHIRLEDLSWHGVEQAMSAIEPHLIFWHDSQHLGVVHNQKAVSFNIVDCALNLCNNLTFDQRGSSHFQKSLWHELLLKYLKPAVVEQTIMAELHPQLAFAAAAA